MDCTGTHTKVSKLLALLGLLVLMGALACVPPKRKDFSPDDDDNDDSSSSDDDDSLPSDDDDDDSSPLCDTDEVVNCENGCTPSSWLADGECNDALNCELWGFDMGDCLQ